MRSVLVVLGQPVVGDGLDLLDGIEQPGVEHFGPEGAVEALDVGVLVGLAGLDVVQRDAPALGPRDEFAAGHLRPVIHADGLRCTVPVDQPVHRADEHRGGQRLRHLDRQRLAVGLVDHVEGAEPPAVVEHVVHEIQRPALVDACACRQRSRLAFRDSALRPARNVQAQLAIHPPDSFVVPRAAIQTQPVEAFPEPPAAVALDHAIERVDHLGILLLRQRRRLVVRRPRQACGPAGSCDRQAMLGHHGRDHLPLRGRRQNFFASTSLIAAFSSARSAYMRLSRAFSASSSRMRVRSETVAPAYLLFHA